MKMKITSLLCFRSVNGEYVRKPLEENRRVGFEFESEGKLKS